MRQGQLTTDDILLGHIDLHEMGFSEIESLGEGWWRPDATYGYHQSPQRSSIGAYKTRDWLDAERQPFGVDPDEEGPE